MNSARRPNAGKNAARARTPRGPIVEARLEGRLGAYARGLLPLSRRTLGRAGHRLALTASHEISLLLCDGPFIRRLNRRYRSIDRATNVLSFPLLELRAGQAPEAGPLGDIVLALPVARAEARRDGLAQEDHVNHLLVHGLLHLLGHDHAREDEAERMEALEDELLEAIR